MMKLKTFIIYHKSNKEKYFLKYEQGKIVLQYDFTTYNKMKHVNIKALKREGSNMTFALICFLNDEAKTFINNQNKEKDFLKYEQGKIVLQYDFTTYNKMKQKCEHYNKSNACT